MQAHLSDDLMRACQRHGLDGRPLDRDAAHRLDLRNARRDEALARKAAADAGPPAPRRPLAIWLRRATAGLRALASPRAAG